MDQELKEIKSALRSVVVSNPTQMNIRSALRDYKSLVGKSLPLAKYGYRDPVDFIKERCNDCFVLSGPSANPVLIPIIPETLQHIDNFVKKQKNSKGGGGPKRRSIIESTSKPTDLIYQTFKVKTSNADTSKQSTKHTPASTTLDIDETTRSTKDSVIKNSIPKIDMNGNSGQADTRGPRDPARNESHQPDTQVALRNFLRKRIPCYNSTQGLNDTTDDNKESSREDVDSGWHTMSSGAVSGKCAQLDKLKDEIYALVEQHTDDLWSTDILRLYRGRYQRELNFTQFGHTSIVSLLYDMPDRLHVWRPQRAGDWRVQLAGAAPPPPHPPPPRRRPPPPSPPIDPEDALPGIEFDPDVFPADCLHWAESIPQESIAGVRPGDMIEVMVGEVYSPSHFWLIRLGENHDIAMEDIMDEMNEYFDRGEGRERRLERGAMRVGQYCAARYEGHWHRALIVRLMPEDRIKVRHVDYGTVDTVQAGELRPLPRRWAALPAQAVRARLTGVRPVAGGRRWPPSASLHFLRLVTDKRLIANVVAVDEEAHALDTLLVDTSGQDDVELGAALVRAQHADAAPARGACGAGGATEPYLYPRFDALETGATPNFAEINRYLRDGIQLDCVDDYRRHVPPALPPLSPPTPPVPPAPPRWPSTHHSHVHSSPNWQQTPDFARPDVIHPVMHSPFIGSRSDSDTHGNLLAQANSVPHPMSNSYLASNSHINSQFAVSNYDLETGNRALLEASRALSASERDVLNFLCEVDPEAAHCYLLVRALRAQGVAPGPVAPQRGSLCMLPRPVAPQPGVLAPPPGLPGLKPGPLAPPPGFGHRP